MIYITSLDKVVYGQATKADSDHGLKIGTNYLLGTTGDVPSNTIKLAKDGVEKNQGYITWKDNGQTSRNKMVCGKTTYYYTNSGYAYKNVNTTSTFSRFAMYNFLGTDFYVTRSDGGNTFISARSGIFGFRSTYQRRWINGVTLQGGTGFQFKSSTRLDGFTITIGSIYLYGTYRTGGSSVVARVTTVYPYGSPWSATASYIQNDLRYIYSHSRGSEPMYSTLYMTHTLTKFSVTNSQYSVTGNTTTVSQERYVTYSNWTDTKVNAYNYSSNSKSDSYLA